MLPIFVRAGYHMIGVWAGGLSYDTFSQGDHAYNPPLVEFLHVPVFLSTGKQDKGLTMVQSREIYRELETDGFRDLKLGVFSGGHEIDADQVKQGLDWFIELANAHPTLAQ
jgi:predicted esterase